MDGSVVAKVLGVLGIGLVIVKDNPCAYTLGVASGILLLVIVKGVNRWAKSM